MWVWVKYVRLCVDIRGTFFWAYSAIGIAGMIRIVLPGLS